MPRDEWAPTRRRDAVRRAKEGKSWSSRKPTLSNKPKTKAKQIKKLRQQMQAAQRSQNNALGKPITLPAGMSVEVRQGDSAHWMPYIMRKTITVSPRAKEGGFTLFSFQGWSIRTPRPNGF